MEIPKCKRCGRTLRNPKWIAVGMGPVCIRKVKAMQARIEDNTQKELAKESGHGA